VKEELHAGSAMEGLDMRQHRRRAACSSATTERLHVQQHDGGAACQQHDGGAAEAAAWRRSCMQQRDGRTAYQQRDGGGATCPAARRKSCGGGSVEGELHAAARRWEGCMSSSTMEGLHASSMTEELRRRQHGGGAA
jgi:hypothetical protein